MKWIIQILQPKKIGQFIKMFDRKPTAPHSYFDQNPQLPIKYKSPCQSWNNKR